MTDPITIGTGQGHLVGDESQLLACLEQGLDLCLATGEAFAVFDWQGEFCQAAVDSDGDMHVESSFGELVKHAGFNKPVIEISWLWGNRLPSEWHARAKMAAGAMTRAFITGGMTFPAELSITILPTRTEPTEPKIPAMPHTEGAPTIGFMFGEDRPRGDFIQALAGAEGLDADTATMTDLVNAIQSRLQTELGPLNRIERYPSDADYIVTLTTDGIELSGG